MSRNPYSPPEAPVSDNTTELPVSQRPKQITWASWAFWISLVLGYASVFLGDMLDQSIAEFSGEERTFAMGGIIVVMVITTVLYLWFIQRMRAGRNWARIVLLVFTVLGLLSELMPDGGGVELSPLWLAVRVLDVLLQIGAIVLMFTPPGSGWFRQQATR